LTAEAGAGEADEVAETTGGMMREGTTTSSFDPRWKVMENESPGFAAAAALMKQRFPQQFAGFSSCESHTATASPLA
jgi:hypothetical protein